MVDGVEFSGRGEAPTEFEVELLLANAGRDATWMLVAKRLIEDLGEHAGACALVAVLDELSSEKVHVPSRQGLFRRLWWTERDRQIMACMLAEPKVSNAEVGRRFGVSRPHVTSLRRQVADANGRDAAAGRTRYRSRA